MIIITIGFSLLAHFQLCYANDDYYTSFFFHQQTPYLVKYYFMFQSLIRPFVPLASIYVFLFAYPPLSSYFFLRFVSGELL
jgi:hypothetical protein